MKNLAQIIGNEQSYLGKLLDKIKQLQHLDKLFHIFVDDKALARHCHLAKLDLANKRIYLTVDNAAWATKLHYARPDILKTLNAQPEFRGIKSIKYSIDLPQKQLEAGRQDTKKKARVKKKISDANEKIWRDTLEMLKDKIKEKIGKAGI